ncbi:MAG: family 10 glycosylhydrolase [bacterium]|nr:family 10 glycosylhydrolase [bacterium]
MNGKGNGPACCAYRTGVSVALVCFFLSVAVSQSASGAENDLKKAREDAKWRERRIMYNDDGCHPRPYTTPDELIALRLRQLTDTQVDTICYCTGGGGLFWGHIPRVGELIGEFVSENDGQYVKDICAGLRALDEQGTDPLAVAVEFGHAKGMEVFWSYRMNNIEDSFAAWSRARWKREHPEYLFGEPEDYGKYPAEDPRKWWSALDFAVPEVRDYMVRIFTDVCSRYDIDGVDMDWFRAPRFFRETNEDRPVSAEHVAMMNDFMRKVRAMTEEVAETRGRPLLISCRVPLSVERCLAIGLDVPTWLEEDLVDILVFGGDLAPMAMAPELRTMTELAHKHNVPAVANICVSGLQPVNGYHTNEAWWAAATNAWQCGVDGIYVFNLFPTERKEQFSRIGSLDTLKGQNKLFAIDWIRPQALFGFDKAGIVAPDRLPMACVPGKPVTAKLHVGEDVVANAPEGQVPHARLRIRLTAAGTGDQVGITLNGIDLGNARPTALLAEAPGPAWFEVVVDPRDLKIGANGVTVRLTSERTSESAPSMDRLELPVSYAVDVGSP